MHSLYITFLAAHKFAESFLQYVSIMAHSTGDCANLKSGISAIPAQGGTETSAIPAHSPHLTMDIVACQKGNPSFSMIIHALHVNLMTFKLSDILKNSIYQLLNIKLTLTSMIFTHFLKIDLTHVSQMTFFCLLMSIIFLKRM